MSRRHLAWALSVALLAFPIALASPVAAAVSDCDTLIVDSAGALADAGAVQQAVDAATRGGAIIRVRAYESVPGGDLDGYIASEQEACPSWQAADGSRRSNLLVLAVSVVDRTTGMYYGSAYDGPLGGQWTRIQADLMNPYFRDGDFDSGMAAGANEAMRLIDAYQHPAGPAAQGSGPTSSQAAEPLDSGFLIGFLALVGGLIALVGIVTGGILGFLAWRRRSRDRAKRDAAAAKAQSAYETAANAFLALDAKTREVTGAVQSLTSVTSAEDDAPMLAAHQTALAAADAASGRWIAAEEPWSPTHLATLTAVQSDAARGQFATITRDLEAASALLDEVDDKTEDAARAMETLPAELERVRGLVDAAKADTTTAGAAGFDVTTLAARLESAGGSLSQVATMLTEHRLGTASALLARVAADAEAASSAATSLSALSSDCSSALGIAEADRAALEAAQPATVATLSALVDRYGPASLTGIDTAVTAIPAALTTVAQAISEGRAALAQRSPEGLARGQGELSRATAALASARDATTQLSDRELSLAELATTMPARLTALDTDVAQARAFVSAHHDDIDPSRTADLEAAAVGAQSITAALGRPKPDLPDLARQLTDTQAKVAAMSRAAQADVRTAEEGRTRAKAALAQAKADLDASESALTRYGGSRVGRADLQTARGYYAQANASTDVALIVSLAAQASRQADQAQASARLAHEEVERAEREAHSASDDDDDDSSRGGSTSFGRGGGGGGSSTW